MGGGSLTLINSTITDNQAAFGGGVFHYGTALAVSSSSITGNRAEGSMQQRMSQHWASLGRRASDRGYYYDPKYGIGGGIVSLTFAGSSISDSIISENSSDGSAGGAVFAAPDGDLAIERSTIADNSANYLFGGLYAGTDDGTLEINGSTISGNSAEAIGGGLVGSYFGSVSINNSTVSGDSADLEIGGILASSYFGQLTFNFATIVNNTRSIGPAGAAMVGASDYYYYYYYDPDGSGGSRGGFVTDPRANASVIAGNLADGQPSDLSAGLSNGMFSNRSEASSILGLFRGGSDSGDRGGPIDVNVDVFSSLLGSTGDGLSLDAVSQNLLGKNPLLGPLADNGGPTLTHLPGADSPVLEVVPQGVLGCGTIFDTDQRGEPRPGPNGCSLGAAETQGISGPMPAPMPVPIGNRFVLLLMAGLLGLAGVLGMRRRGHPLG